MRKTRQARKAYEEPLDCNFARRCRHFAYSFKPRKFRLVQPTIPPASDDAIRLRGKVCCHYVAVSYCWPVPEKDDQEGNREAGSYKVRDLDGTVRLSRALDNVLDRAVEFANVRGIRMIWIDQECLPQPKEDSPQEHKTEQELGVQSHGHCLQPRHRHRRAAFRRDYRPAPNCCDCHPDEVRVG